MAVLRGRPERECRRAVAKGSGYRRKVLACTADTRGSLRAHGQARGSGGGKRKSLISVRRRRIGGIHRGRLQQVWLQECSAKLARRLHGTVEAQLCLALHPAVAV